MTPAPSPRAPLAFLPALAPPQLLPEPRTRLHSAPRGSPAPSFHVGPTCSRQVSVRAGPAPAQTPACEASPTALQPSGLSAVALGGRLPSRSLGPELHPPPLPRPSANPTRPPSSHPPARPSSAKCFPSTSSAAGLNTRRARPFSPRPRALPSLPGLRRLSLPRLRGRSQPTCSPQPGAPRRPRAPFPRPPAASGAARPPLRPRQAPPPLRPSGLPGGPWGRRRHPRPVGSG